MPSFSNAFKTGELGGTLTAAQNPDVPSQWVAFQAAAGNTGNVWIGGKDVTTGDGTTDTTTGVPIAPGKWSPWIAVSNLNQTYRICDGIGDSIYYMIVG